MATKKIAPEERKAVTYRPLTKNWKAIKMALLHTGGSMQDFLDRAADRELRAQNLGHLDLKATAKKDKAK
jgi:hypothetical protein